jgi:hypothetical protein
MNATSQRHLQLSTGHRLAALAASAAITLSLFAGVVSLADDQPMAIAGQSSARTLAQKDQPASAVLAMATQSYAQGKSER